MLLLWVSPESCHFVRAIEETGTIAYDDIVETFTYTQIVVKNLVILKYKYRSSFCLLSPNIVPDEIL